MTYPLALTLKLFEFDTPLSRLTIKNQIPAKEISFKIKALNKSFITEYLAYKSSEKLQPDKKYEPPVST